MKNLLLTLICISQITFSQIELPRIMVVVDEMVDEKSGAGKVNGRIESLLLEKGFRLVDKAQFEESRLRDLQQDLNPTKAKELGKRFGAEWIIIGKANANLGDEREVYGSKQFEYTADAEIKLILTDVGEIFARSSASERKQANGKSQAASKSLEAVGATIANDVIAKIEKKLKDDQEKPITIQLVLLGVTDQSLTVYEKELPQKISAIKKIKVRYLEGDAAVCDATIQGSIDDLRQIFSQMSEFKVESFTGSRIDLNIKAGTKQKVSNVMSSALEISEFRIDNLFPTQFSFYAANPLAEITLENTDKKNEIKNVKVSVFIPTYMQMASEQVIPLIKGGEKKSFPISAVLDKDKLLNVTERTVSQVKAEISYNLAGEQKSRSITKPVTVYSRNSVSWNRANSIGAFITPKDDAVKNFSRFVIGNLKVDPKLASNTPRNVLNAMAIWDAVKSFSINYVVDPWVVTEQDVLDDIQFPRETLANKAGDCDDSSVLLASCLENIGIRTILIGTSDHVFIMFDTGVNPKNSSKISLNEKEFVVHENSVWLPLETTIINKPFSDAWALGADGFYKAQSAGGKIDLIDVRKAWEVYPPANLAVNVKSSEPPTSEAINSLVVSDLISISKNKSEQVNQKVEFLKKEGSEKSKNEAAMLLSQVEKYDEAINEIKNYSSASSKNNLGNLYMLKGDSANAIASYQEAAKSDSKDGGIELNIGLLKYLGGDHNGTVESFASAVSKFPNPKSAYETLGIENIMENIGQTRAAEKNEKVDKGELQNLLKSALSDVKENKNKRDERAKLRKGENKFIFGGRRGIDPTALASIKEFLYWKF